MTKKKRLIAKKNYTKLARLAKAQIKRSKLGRWASSDFLFVKIYLHADKRKPSAWMAKSTEGTCFITPIEISHCITNELVDMIDINHRMSIKLFREALRVSTHYPQTQTV